MAAGLETERELLRELSALLKEARWEAQQEPVVRDTQPDLLIRSPDGRTFVVEVEAGPGPAHFLVLSALSHAKDELERSRGPVGGLLVTTRRVAPSLLEEAKELGVHIVRAASSQEPPKELAQRAAAFLGLSPTDLAGGRPRPEPTL